MIYISDKQLDDILMTGVYVDMNEQPVKAKEKRVTVQTVGKNSADWSTRLSTVNKPDSNGNTVIVLVITFSYDFPDFGELRYRYDVCKVYRGTPDDDFSREEMNGKAVETIMTKKDMVKTRLEKAIYRFCNDFEKRGIYSLEMVMHRV